MKHALALLLSLTVGACEASSTNSAQTQQGSTVRPERPTLPRVPPVEEPWTPDQAAYLEPYQAAGRLFNVFMTAAHDPQLATSFGVFAGYINSASLTLTPRDRELLILRSGWLWGAEYVWAAHARVARSVGVTDDELLRIIEGPGAAGWTTLEASLIRAVDELHDDGFITDQTWAELADGYSTQQMMDAVFTVGAYTTVSMVLNSLGVQLDDGLVGFPNARP